MTINDFTIPEAEVIYQKAVIRGAWWFFGFMLLCIFVYFVVRKIMEDRKDERTHQRKMASIKASEEIGQTGAWTASANRGCVIEKQKKKIEWLEQEIRRKDRHIESLEATMESLHFGDVADRIRKENEDEQNESEDRR